MASKMDGCSSDSGDECPPQTQVTSSSEAVDEVMMPSSSGMYPQGAMSMQQPGEFPHFPVTVKSEAMDEDMELGFNKFSDLDRQSATSTTLNRPPKDKVCLVCGDKALGYNFNAITCESCKAFFRRNAFKTIRGRCEGKCDVTVESRSYCKKCRLHKCFVVGMRKDLILNDEQKKVRRRKIEENRMRRAGLPVAPAPDEDTNSGDDNSNARTYKFAAVVAPDTLEGLPRHVKDHVMEIMAAFKNSFDAPVNKLPMTNPSNADFLNMADASVRRLVKMAKNLEAFKKLDQADQIALLKGAVLEVLILRSSKLFDVSCQSWSVSYDPGKKCVISSNVFQYGNEDNMRFFSQYKDFVGSVLRITKGDNILLMLMIVLTVFSPDRPQVVHKESISAAQEEYAQVLKEYLRINYKEDPNMFARILTKLADIRDLNETHTRMLLRVRVEEVEPLVVEIFHLSSGGNL